ncbi:MAG: DUF427 domain-containing protein [Planctomycetota bacterium]
MVRKRMKPGPGQESVWDYPRPPAVEPCSWSIRVEMAGIVIAETAQSIRVMETSHPPVYYLPPDDIRMDLMQSSDHGSFCEWKGYATYHTLTIEGKTVPNLAWSYRSPTERFESLAGYLAFYPSKVDACFVDGEQVEAQPGDFYGGWITSRIVGPFKGGPGTMGW